MLRRLVAGNVQPADVTGRQKARITLARTVNDDCLLNVSAIGKTVGIA